ncbi:hypothetical protein BKA62DRAFT_768998 [Auriculariales sp. MPI-PUGE-AT-0066]|nr:hypothetical protein BKA62DRAFT_768998 [Auriculariales sp. MPI-PUGE-AT-0066]
MPSEDAGPFFHLTHTAPILQQLSVTAEESVLCLPKAQQLVRVHLDCEEIVMSDPLSQWPKVNNWCSFFGGDKSERFCTAYAAQLVELFLVEHYWLSETLYLPCLITLLLNDSGYLDCIRAPNLRNLALKPNGLEEHEDSTSHFAGIQHLTLYGKVGIKSIRPLGHLTAVSKISFMIPIPVQKVYSHGRATCNVHSGVFTQLAQAQPPLWPHLEHISFGPELDGIHFDDILTFVKSRNLRVAEGVEGRHRSIIKDLVMSPQIEEIPAWFSTQLAALLS